MWGRVTFKQFKEGAWQSQDELEAFVRDVGALPPAEIGRLLGVLLDERSVAQGPRHRNRCSAFAAIALGSLDRGLFAPFVQALPRADPALRRVLVELVPRVNDVEAHRHLCRLLGSESEELRRIAAELLEQIGGPAALAHLTRMVRDASFAGRAEAMEVMVPKARYRAINLLGGIVRAGTPRQRTRALRHLSDPGIVSGHADEAVAAVKAALKDSDRRIVAEAFKAFGRLVPEQHFFDELEAQIYATDVEPSLIESLGAYSSPRALAVLENKVRVGPNAVRLAAILALEEIGTERSVPPLVAALEVDDVAVRRRATEALTALSRGGKVHLARTVVELLRSRNDEVRRVGAHLARTAEDASGTVTPKLLEFLRDEDWWVRERVMDALVEMRAPGLTEHVVRQLEDPSPVMRRFAVRALLQLRDPASLGAILKAAAGDEDWWVREQAVQAAAELGDRRAVPYLHKLALQRADLRVAALGALRALEAHEELVELAELAGDDDAEVRLALVQVLHSVPQGSKTAFYVQTLVSDPDLRVARAAKELLEHWEVPHQREAEAAALGLLDRLLVAASRADADDLVLAAGRSPYIKRLGAMTRLSRGVLSEDDLLSMVVSAMNPLQREAFRRGKDVDFSYEVQAHNLRFRVNLFRQLTGTSAVFRRVSQHVPEIEELGLPPIVQTFGDYSHGLVLVGGPTGSGKSTTLAALIDHINRTSSRHIVTIEDPIEVVHPQRRCLVNQREVGSHARSFDRALRSTLRQDPDVILVGELRDLETIDFAVNAAETGHLVLGTVHTVSADHTIDRIVHAFPASQQGLVRSMLAESLRAVLCQQLLRRVDADSRRVLATEVLLNNDAVSNLIRKDKGFQISSVITTHRELGMRLMDAELERLVKSGAVDAEEALMKAVDKNGFAQMLVTAGYLHDAADHPSLPPEARRSLRPASVPSERAARPSGESPAATSSFPPRPSNFPPRPSNPPRPSEAPHTDSAPPPSDAPPPTRGGPPDRVERFSSPPRWSSPPGPRPTSSDDSKPKE